MDTPTTAQAKLVNLYRVERSGRRFNTTDFAKFLRKATNKPYPAMRLLAKALINYELRTDGMHYVDKKRGVFRFSSAEEKLPGFVVNDKKTVGKRFLNLVPIDRVSPLRGDFYKCHICGLSPTHLQPVWKVFTPYGITNVVMCPFCNRVITEVE